MDIIILLTGVFGLIIGSFLNVVIARYPKMLQQEWQQECQLLLNLSSTFSFKPYNLMLPRSHCPHCQQFIKIWHNIPLLSFILLKGRCAFCHERISWIYPAVELLSALSIILVIFKFNLSWPALFAVLFTFGLITLSFIDLKEQILPDSIVYSLLWLGLLSNIFHIYTSLENAVYGAIFGYTSLWIINKLFQLIRKKVGMGHGDFKMLAMIGAWVGAPLLLYVILIAAITGLLTSLVLLLVRKMTVDTLIPFGPFLALGGWISLLYGPPLMNWLIRIA